jgi:hypothetical protein
VVGGIRQRLEIAFDLIAPAGQIGFNHSGFSLSGISVARKDSTRPRR